METTRVVRTLSTAAIWSLVAASVMAIACSSQQSVPDAGTSGTGGVETVGGTGGSEAPDLSCLDGSDGCVWSCSVGAESGTGDSPFPFCDADHKLRCPTSSVALSSCPPRACAHFGLYCCDAITGKLVPPPCNPDGFRATVCADGSAVLTQPRCVPPGLNVVSSCVELETQPCDTMDQECTLQGACRCVSQGGRAPTWDCPVYIP
jgi:hypothetical protein